MTDEKRATVHLIGNAHIDPVWLWRWQEGFAEVKATFRSALDRMEETDDYVFTSSSVIFYKWVEENDPGMFAEICGRVEEGRWSVVGGWWIEPDCNIPGGEALVRQGLYGQRYFEEKFGRICEMGFCVDSFGHAGTLPKLLAGCGMRGYVFMRPHPHETGEVPLLAFRWRGDDGSEVTTLRIPGAYGAGNPERLEQEISRSVELAAGTPLVDQVFVFYGVGNHGGGPTKELLRRIEEWQEQEDGPELVHSSLPVFLEIAEGKRLPMWKGELQHHARGCYSAVSALKVGNRRGEEGLIGAEMWGAAGRVALGKRPETAMLAQGWKDVLFNQFHDILAGSSVEEACRDAELQQGSAVHVAEVVGNSARQAISWAIDTSGEGAPLVLFNEQPFSFSGVVETEDVGFLVADPGKGTPGLLDNEGQVLPSQGVEPHTICGRRRFAVKVDIPALGYAVVRQGEVKGSAVKRLLGKGAVRVGKLTLENEYLRVGLDRRGYATLYDRKRRRQVFDKGGGIPLVIEDHSDTWSHGVDSFRKVAGRFKRVGAEIVEDGPVRGCLAVRYAWGDSLLTLEYSLGAGESFVKVRGKVDWREQWKALKLAFPQPLRAEEWTGEVAYGTAVRATNGEEEPIQQWLDLSAGERGLAVANDGRYSCSVEPGEMRVTILRSPPYAFHNPFEPDDFARHEFTDQGVQRFELALVPHGGDWRESGVIEVARQLNRPPRSLSETFHEGRLPAVAGFVECRGKGVYIGAIKEAEDGGGIVVRAMEWFGKRRKATFGIPALGREWSAIFRGNEVKSFFVPDDRRKKVREVDMLEK